MANVLNRTTLQYLESVNTPDYPDTEWIVNPDMSGITEHYPYWVIVGDTVRDMTAEEKSAWEAAHPVQVVASAVQYLVDGTPAYYYPTADAAISIEKTTVTFSTRTNGAKNFYLDLQNADSSTNGFPVKRKALIKSLSLSLKASVTDTVTIQIKDQQGIAVAAMVLPAGQKTGTLSLAGTISANSVLSCYLSSTKPVANPIVICELAWRD